MKSILNNLEIELLNQFRKIDSDYEKLEIIGWVEFKANNKKALVVQLPIVFNKRKHKNKDIQAKKKQKSFNFTRCFEYARWQSIARSNIRNEF